MNNIYVRRSVTPSLWRFTVEKISLRRTSEALSDKVDALGMNFTAVRKNVLQMSKLLQGLLALRDSRHGS